MRSPLLVAAVLRRAGRLGLQELCLMDSDARKLELIGALARHQVQASGLGLRLTTTASPAQALQGARFVITTIRPGCEQGRIQDERIALRHGVLGQETTGPGGFGMALRSIPAILEYAALLEKLSPGAWMFNFTNPAGLVTQALQDAGFSHTVGICDSANAAQGAVAAWLGPPQPTLRAEVFGLNHLSWARRVWRPGEEADLLHPLLHDPAFQQASLLRLFQPALLRLLDLYPNEYLFYYYYRQEALAQVAAAGHTRGEQVLELNQALLAELERIDPTRRPAEAQAAYQAYLENRSGSYMPYSAPIGTPSPSSPEGWQGVSTNPPGVPAPPGTQAAPPRDLRKERRQQAGEEGEGYAGVALDIMEALEGGAPLYTALNVPNQNAIPGMAYEDVVEVSCRVDRSGVQPIRAAAPPPPGPLGLMQAVKNYERLAVQAALTRSPQAAIQALLAHPLVMSYSLAEALASEYLAAPDE